MFAGGREVAEQDIAAAVDPDQVGVAHADHVDALVGEAVDVVPGG